MDSATLETDTYNPFDWMGIESNKQYRFTIPGIPGEKLEIKLALSFYDSIIKIDGKSLHGCLSTKYIELCEHERLLEQAIRETEVVAVGQTKQQYERMENHMLRINSTIARIHDEEKQLASLRKNLDEKESVLERAHESLLRQVEKLKQERETFEIERAELHQLRIQTAYGFVYLIHNATQDTYKIGKSKDPVKRLSQLRTSSPDEIAIVCTIETSDMDRLEGELHQEFADKHIRGEWFRLTQPDVEYIKDRA